MTTLHGTDITLVGSDPSYAASWRFSIEQSDGVTAVSREPARPTRCGRSASDARSASSPTSSTAPSIAAVPIPTLRERLCPAGECDALVVHVSNFRPVKRVDAAIEVFRRSASSVPRPLRAHRRRPGARRHRAPRRRARARPATSSSSASSTISCRGSRSPTCSCCRRRRRASAWPRSRRWRARCRSSRRRSAGCRRSSRTASPGSSVRPTRSTRWPSAASRSSTDAELRESIGRRAAEIVRTRYCNERIVPLYEAEGPIGAARVAGSG